MRAVVLARLVNKPTEEAVQALRELLKTDPSSEHSAHTVLTVLVQQRKDAEALAIAQEMLRRSPHNEGLVELIVELRARTHWSMKPLWPVLKYGWAGSAGIWFGYIVLVYALGEVLPENSKLFAVLIGVFLGYVAYSWIWPGLLRKWLSR